MKGIMNSETVYRVKSGNTVFEASMVDGRVRLYQSVDGHEMTCTIGMTMWNKVVEFIKGETT